LGGIAAALGLILFYAAIVPNFANLYKNMLNSFNP